MYLRINVSGMLEKLLPISAAKLTALQTAIADVRAYARKINEFQANEELSVKADINNLPDRVEFVLDIAIPEDLTGTLVLSSLDPMTGQQVGGIRIATAIVPKLTSLRTKVREVRQYLKKNDENGKIMADVFLCNHDSGGRIPDGERFEI